MTTTNVNERLNDNQREKHLDPAEGVRRLRVVSAAMTQDGIENSVLLPRTNFGQ